MPRLSGHPVPVSLWKDSPAWGGTAYRIELRGRADDDIERAVKLLNAGMTRAEVRAVLMDTRGLSRRTAYRRISAALSAIGRVRSV